MFNQTTNQIILYIQMPRIFKLFKIILEKNIKAENKSQIYKQYLKSSVKQLEKNFEIQQQRSKQQKLTQIDYRSSYIPSHEKKCQNIKYLNKKQNFKKFYNLQFKNQLTIRCFSAESVDWGNIKQLLFTNKISDQTKLLLYFTRNKATRNSGVLKSKVKQIYQRI